MTQKFSSVVKKTFLKCFKLVTKNFFFQTIKNLVYPPLCHACNDDSCYILFCKSCWLKCSFVDPIYRCCSCFKESEGVCYECLIGQQEGVFRAHMFVFSRASKLLISIDPDITASFMIIFWDYLGWQLPELFVCDATLIRETLRLSNRLNIAMVEVKDLFFFDLQSIQQKKVLFLTLSFSLEDFKVFSSQLSFNNEKPKYIFSLFETMHCI